MGRIIIFTGKGGVGKTSLAAAHAMKAAKEGENTLLISTDMAHNLSDLFQIPLGKEVVKITEHLDTLEVNPQYEMKHEFSSMMSAFDAMFQWGSTKTEASQEFSYIPGMDDLFSLLKIQSFYEKQIYDLIVVDCAPTGETLSLLKFPELLSWYMEKFFPLGKVAMKVMRPISKQFFKLQLPDGKAMNDIERSYLQLMKLQELLKDRSVCGIRLVTIPEKMAVVETKRSYMYLNLYNFNVDGLYINRILPMEVENSFFDQWKKIQSEYIQELCDTFTEIPIYKIRWYDTDFRGLCSLEPVIKEINHKDILEIKKRMSGETFEKVETGYQMRVQVPFARKEEIQMHQVPGELIIKIGNQKRNIPLPDILRGYTVTGANYLEGHQGCLVVSLKKEDVS